MPERERFVIPDLQRIGKYDILERIAEGGFATLYRGRDPFLKRLVAIKVCASEDVALRQQFLREAEIAGNLDHPSIVRTFDFGFDPVGPYLVQEYLQGEDLSRLIAERAALSPRRKLDLLIQVAEGLAYSHARLVLHLDIKPANVRVLGRRNAKILDFGIARLATSDAPPPPSGMIGTAGYLPPEQVMGREVDARADVFSFGALSYELLTFCRPFTGGTMPELLKRVLGAEAEPMKRYWPDCNDALANLIGRCLRRDPGARYPSFDAILRELIEIRDSFPEVPEVEAAGELGARGAAAPVGRSAGVGPDATGLFGLTGSAGEASAGAGATSASAAATSTSAAATSADAAATSTISAAPDKAPARAASAPRSKVALVAGLAAAAAVVVIALVAFVPAPEPVVAPAADVPASPPAEPGPAPGVLVVTAVPWGEVTSVAAADGSAAELPESRLTPLRLWVAPGLHQVEVTLAGGAVATCSAEVTEGGVHPCRAAPPAVGADGVAGSDRERASASALDGTTYFKEMGWWR